MIPSRRAIAGTNGTRCGAGFSAVAFGSPVTVTEAVTNCPDVRLVAVSSSTPPQAVPKVVVVMMTPLASVVPDGGLKVTVQPLPPPVEEKRTLLPGPPGEANLAVNVPLPPGGTVVDEVVALAPELTS
jgi:hypothetical protein